MDKNTKKKTYNKNTTQSTFKKMSSPRPVSWTPQEGGVSMESSREHSKHAPVWMHRYTSLWHSMNSSSDNAVGFMCLMLALFVAEV